MDQIYRKARETEVFAAIKDAPRELDNMIRHVFERLDRDEDISKKDLNIMLTWVTLAKRPLLMGELDLILCLPNGEHYMPLNKHLKGRFASLFKLLRQDSDNQDDEDTTEVDEVNSTLASAQIFEEALNFDKSDEEDSDSENEHDEEQNDATIDQSEDYNRHFQLDDKTMKVYKSTRIEFSHLRIKEFLLRVCLPDLIRIGG